MLCANQYYRVSVGFVFINRKQHKLIAKPHITNDYKSALTISIILYFTMALVTFTLISLNHKPSLGALNDWNVPGSWLHAFCLWLIKSYLLIRSSSSPEYQLWDVGNIPLVLSKTEMNWIFTGIILCGLRKQQFFASLPTLCFQSKHCRFHWWIFIGV